MLLPFVINADVLDELDSKISEWQKQWQILEDQRQEYLKTVKQKRTAAANLENQMALLDGEIKFAETKIKQTEVKLEQITLEIEKLNAEIRGKGQDITRQKEFLASLLREIYNSGNEDLLSNLLKNNNLSDFLTSYYALESVQGKISASVIDLKNLKEKLEWNRKEEISKKAEIDTLKIGLVQEKESLNLARASKKDLLSKTKGEQSRYENLLKRVEEQRQEILGNIEELQITRAKELARIQSKQLLPEPNPVAALWHYYQTDPRWGDTAIGNSNSTMKFWGCAVAALAMLFKYHNEDITPGNLAKQPLFSFDLIKWPNSWRSINLVANEVRQKVNWNKVDENLKNGHPVIVYVRALPNTRTKGGGHYVVVFAKDSRGYIVNDSMWGSNIYLDSTRENIATLYETTTSVEQMILYK
ncbi:MAG: C39 family peptidase [bacterium]|nr:C39 family peptidase [bacterium]